MMQVSPYSEYSNVADCAFTALLRVVDFPLGMQMFRILMTENDEYAIYELERMFFNDLQEDHV